MRDLADSHAADDVGGALQGVDGAEQPRDVRLVDAALERPERRGHPVEVLGRLRQEVRDHVRVPREERLQLLAEGVEARVGSRRRCRNADRGRRRVDRRVERMLEMTHERAEPARVGRAPGERLFQLRRQLRDVRESVQRGGALQAVRDDEQLVHALGARQRRRRAVQRGHGVPRLHQEDGAEELLLGRLGHRRLRSSPT